MTPFTRLSAPAVPLGLANVDTDQLIPARFMKRSRAEGYGQYLLHDLRFDAQGRPRPDMALNDPRHAGAAILVARRNFGAGSSREAAVYALVDYGIRCVVAPSFGDIFAANAVNNGLLPAQVGEAEAERLLEAVARDGPGVSVDLETLTIAAAGLRIGFALDPVWRTKLLNGWDDLDLTASHAGRIREHAEATRRAWPWLQDPRL